MKNGGYKDAGGGRYLILLESLANERHPRLVRFRRGRPLVRPRDILGGRIEPGDRHVPISFWKERGVMKDVDGCDKCLNDFHSELLQMDQHINDARQMRSHFYKSRDNEYTFRIFLVM